MHFMVGNRRRVPLTGDQICFMLQDKLYLQQKHTTVEPLLSKTAKRHLRDRRMYPLKRGLNRSQFIDCPPKKMAVEERLPFLESGGRRWRFDCITASKNSSRFQSYKVPQAKGHFDSFQRFITSKAGVQSLEQVFSKFKRTARNKSSIAA